jgi:general secretion pathway protein C
VPLLLVAALALALPDLRLHGVVVHAQPERSVALLGDGTRTRSVATGESAFGARVVSIARGRVVLDVAGERRELLLAGGAPSPAPAAAVVSRPAAAPDVPFAEGRAGERTLDRAEVERRLLLEIPRILAETTLLPVSDEGQVVGFTLARLPEGSLLSDIGLQPGDVLTEINGTAIDSLATLAGLYTRQRGESEIRAQVLRGGSAQSLTLRLR